MVSEVGMRLATANAALRGGDALEAVRSYARLLASHDTPHLTGLEFDLSYARNLYLKSHRDQQRRMAVCGWEMAHNAAGRVRALADLHAAHADCTLVGPAFAHWGKTVWEPIDDARFPLALTSVEDQARFPAHALDLVLGNPAELVHLSKPRMPTIILGLFYKALWGARVLMDVDDEDLAIVGAEAPMPLDELLAWSGGSPDWAGIVGREWTRVAVGLWDLFDGVTVSNEALRMRYGGQIVPHARSAAVFAPDPERRCASRARVGIGAHETVVLFFGTPRRHKGVLETARAMSRLGRDDLVYVVAGAFEDLDLKREIEALPRLRLICLPNQPYAAAAEVVAMGDLCVILQDTASAQARLQFPAKLVDALAGGLLTFVTRTPALAPVLDAGAAVEVTRETLGAVLSRYLSARELGLAVQIRGRAWFEDNLSIEACQPALKALIEAAPVAAPLGRLFADDRQAAIAARLGLFPAARL